MPDDCKAVYLCGPDLGYLETLAIHLDDVAETTIVTSTNEIDDSHDVLVWHLKGAFPSEDLARISDSIPTLLIADQHHLLDAVDAGVRGFLPNDVQPDQVRDSVVTIARGGAAVPPELLGQLLRHVVERRRSERVRQGVSDTLTSRELEVYNLAVRGARRDEIADRLFISPATVRTHLQNVYRKLGVHSQTELMSEHEDGITSEGARDK